MSKTTRENGNRSHLKPVGRGASASKRSREPLGLSIPRYFTEAGSDPFDQVEWELRSAKIGNESGETVFEQNDVEIPKSWSQLATNVVVSKYFRGHMDTPEREHSVKQLIGRVVAKIREWGDKSGYFKTEADSQSFSDELTHLLVQQKMAFNSPVWFNLGVPNTSQQASACFINSVDDTMESIMGLAKTEAMLFKGGSGAGSNLSSIRSSREHLAGGGTASGPVSFMRGFDSFAGVVKSGGKTRRAAKMVILNVDHPDIMEFVTSKSDEEKKAWSLIDAGYDGGFNVPGGAYDSVFFQNANHSVRVTDDFMQSALEDGQWRTRAVTTGEVTDTYRARDILREMADATHICGDPGIQYDTTINRWNPVKASGRINSSNPCSEYMFLDDTACNLASLNLMQFLDEQGEFDVPAYRRAAALTILAQEILVDHANYPTAAITRNSHLYRPLGLGYANLGALLMSMGLPYDGDAGRNMAASLTAAMCGQAYATSAEIAEAMGPFARYRANRKSFLEVIEMHKDAAEAIPATGVPAGRGARHRARQVQEAGGRRVPQDREHHGPDGARQARLRRRDDREDHRLHRRARDDRGLARPEGGAPVGVRLRLPGRQGLAQHPLDGARAHDGRGAAVPVGRDQQDGEPARGSQLRRHHARVRGGLEARPEGPRGLPRRQQAHPAAQRRQGRDGRQGRRARRGAPRSHEAAGRATGPHPQVLDRGPRGLPHGRPVRERPAG
jgi:ribonucleoside-diphosphate reductase alpha chain